MGRQDSTASEPAGGDGTAWRCGACGRVHDTNSTSCANCGATGLPALTESTADRGSLGSVGSALQALTSPLMLLAVVVLSLIGATLLLGGVAVPTPGGPPTLTDVEGSATTGAGVSLPRVETETYARINALRDDAGTQRISLSARLSAVAAYHNKHMVANDYVGREGPDGTTPSDRFLRFGYLCTRKGSTLVYRGTPGGDAKQFAVAVMENLRTAERTRAIFLEGHTAVGVDAYAVGESVYVTMTFC